MEAVGAAELHPSVGLTPQLRHYVVVVEHYVADGKLRDEVDPPSIDVLQTARGDTVLSALLSW
jgi:hypothetical protein